MIQKEQPFFIGRLILQSQLWYFHWTDFQCVSVVTQHDNDPYDHDPIFATK